MTVQLTDQPARDRIVNGHDENLFVDAGAGSGKTKQLVDRIVALVATGHLPSVQALAAITFTENAATELRTRVREALEDAAVSTKLAADERERCTQALIDLDDAAITTLHGYASRLLADAPMEAGLPPGFRVHDAVRTSIDRDAWWRRLLDDWYAEPRLSEVWRVGLTLGLTPAYLKEVAVAFDANWDLLIRHPIVVQSLPVLDPTAVLAPLQRLLEYAGDQGPVGDRLTKHIDAVIVGLVRETGAEPDPLQALAILAEATIQGGNIGSGPAWAKVGLHKPTACGMLDESAQARDAQVAACRVGVTTALTARLREAVLDHARERRERGELWFHDLLVYAVQLLRGDPEVRAATRQRWQVVCVDEFQDTDPLQVELVHLIAGLDDGAWPEASVDGGRLFFVGDPKQSIYRFRRAEVSLFAQVRDIYEPGRLGLTHNFRSRPAILAAVNAVFESHLGGDPTIGYQALEAARRPVASDPGPDVLLIGGPSPEAIGKVRDDETEHLASTLAQARGSWLVDKDSARPATYGDMAILVPTRTSLGQLEDALDRHNVPYRIMSRSLIWESDAVRDLVTVLQAIDEPADQVALAATLRHPMFACSDDDLVAWRVGGGSWRYEAPVPDELQDSSVAAGMQAIRRYHQLRWWLPVNVLLDRIIRERRAIELTAAYRRPRDHWRRLRFLVDQSRLFLDSGGTGLTEFVRWALEQIESAADAIETVTPERDDDAVQILTIHGSKGLEFPIVALTGINSGPFRGGHVLWPHDAPPEVTLNHKFTTAGHGAAQQADRILEEAEALRLLYVGMTRAADHLVVSMYHHPPRKGKVETHALRLYAMLSELAAVGAVHEPALSPAEGLTAATISPTDGLADVIGQRNAFLESREKLLTAVVRRLPTTATGLLAASEPEEPADPLVDAVTEAVDVLPPISRSGATLGSAVHRALELIDLAVATREGVQRAATAACTELGIRRLEHQVSTRVLVALDAPILQEAARSRHWKEVPIVAALDGRIVEGFIDLVIDGDEGLIIVDYKTDSVRSAVDVEAKVAHYTPQLRAYARAVSVATGRPIVRAVLLFCGPDRAQPREIALDA